MKFNREVPDGQEGKEGRVNVSNYRLPSSKFERAAFDILLFNGDYGDQYHKTDKDVRMGFLTAKQLPKQPQGLGAGASLGAKQRRK